MIDCDPGIDDALAILFALSSDKIRVEAITTVYGNVSVSQCTSNLMNILDISGVKKTPEIGKGSKRPLVKERMKPRRVHGRDGLGEINLSPPKGNFIVNDAVKLAVSKILSKKIDYIIATGPLTNIAKIITKDSKVPSLIKRIYIMGGAFFVRGNVTPYAEFNIYNDPEATKMVFDSKIPKTLVGLDVTHKAVLEKGDLKRFIAIDNRLSRFIVHIADFAIEYHERFRDVKGAYMNDPLCVGVAIDEALCEYDKGPLEVRLSGAERGRIIVSDGNRKKTISKISYCKDVNAPMFKKLFLDTLEELCKKEAN